MSFIGSLAAVGTAVAESAGVAGLSTGTAALLGAGTMAAGGAGLGAATSAAMGGDPGQGAMMGAITAPLLAPLAPAAGVGGAAAENVATNVGTNVATNVGTNVAENVGANAATQGGIQALGQGAEQTALQTGTRLAPYAVQNVVPQAVTNTAATQALGQGAEQTALQTGTRLAPFTAQNFVPQTFKNTAEAALTKLPEVGWGQSLVGNAFNTPVTGTMAKIGGSALEQGVYGAGIGGLSSAATGQDVGKGMGTGFLGGAIGGAGQGALAGQAGATGTLGKIGTFAAEHPTITSAAIGMPVTMGLNAMNSGPSIEDTRNAANASDRAQFLKYLRAYRPSLAPGYAAGGITDLDGYMSNAQNIPNANEVADPEGYPTDSIKMMASGGLSSLFPGGQGGADWMAKNSLPGMIFGWKGASDVPLIGSMFNDPNTASLSPEEKKKLMAMAAAQGQPAPTQAMAHGGIADLGGYRSGGSPNLLHGPGTGVSDDIPATIEGKQPARLAAGEYVVPSRIVSELGNGSTDAGAKRLDAMVQKINAGRAKTLGGKKYAADTRAYKHLPV